MGNTKSLLYKSLKQSDPELTKILRNETKRQLNSLELIASENYTSVACLEANGSIFTNKYAEGYPGHRYYGGCEHIDELEILCQERALDAFHLDPEVWGVNIQGLSGSPANFAVYAGILKPGNRIMGMALPSGGHLTHGAMTPTGKKLSNSSIFFESKQYTVDPISYLIDYDKLHMEALDFKPHLLIVGASAYPRDYNYTRFRKTADAVGAYLMADIAHTSGLVASQITESPFNYCDVVTTTTHKTLRGPRGALIFYKLALKEKIDFSVFPGSQGGAHYNTVAAVATALRQVSTQEYKQYIYRVVSNASYLGNCLKEHGFDLVTGGTDVHLLLINLSKHGINGSKYEKIAEMCGLSLNKNTIASDKSALNPSGIRIGTPAMTSRGFNYDDFKFTADCMKNILDIVLKINENTVGIKMVNFNKNIHICNKEIRELKRKVSKYCKKFPLPKLLV